MEGQDLLNWRKRNGYDQQSLMDELGVGSRQTLSNWENSKRPVPRTVELALIALERFPECRNTGGKKASPKERAAFLEKIARSEC